jgi:hypothetical protein
MIEFQGIGLSESINMSLFGMATWDLDIVFYVESKLAGLELKRFACNLTFQDAL